MHEELERGAAKLERQSAADEGLKTMEQAMIDQGSRLEQTAGKEIDSLKARPVQLPITKRSHVCSGCVKPIFCILVTPAKAGQKRAAR